ncbi:MAG: DUF542 domain-containing protein [Tissierellia bacterium]|nr:DUF542 domain-containing protein [Tissierellia bacterium]
MNKDTKLAEVVRQYPQLMEIFNDLSIDYCCGGKDSLQQAAAKGNYEVESLLELLERKAQEGEGATEMGLELEAFEALSLEEMVKSLRLTHHRYERELMEEISKDLNKILVVHYPNHKNLLLQVHHLYGLLKMELEEHFAGEEQESFPWMLERDPSKVDAILELEEDHEAAGDLIKEILDATKNLSLPQGACATFERTYRNLRLLFDDIFVHIYKENSIMFPKYRKEMTP